MLKRIVWKDNDVFSVRLRDDLFTLAQMRTNQIMQFFDVFRTTNDWSGLDLNSVRSLFYLFVADNRLKPLFVEKLTQKVVMPSEEPIPKLMLSFTVGENNTYGADLIELTDSYESYGGRVVKSNLSEKDDLKLIHTHELCGMVGDPEKIRNRLLRYVETGVNWDEGKSFIFKGIQPPLPSQEEIL